MASILILLFVFLTGSVCSQKVCSYQEVLDYLHLTRDNEVYTSTRPVLDYKNPTVVRLDITLYAILAVKWNNERISWDPSQFCGITELSLPKEMLWRPDLLIAEMTEMDNASQSPYVYIYYDGNVTFEEDLKVVSTCKMDVHKFPFDTQSCNITISSVIHNINELRLVPSSNSSRVTQFSRRVMQTQGEWDFLNMCVTNNTFIIGPEQWDQIIYTISMKRRPLLHVINFLLPVLFFLCLDLSSFLISDHRGDKLGFKVTVLLAISVLLLILNEILPSMSNRTPLIATYCIVIFALMLLSLLETVLVTYLMEKDSEEGGVTKREAALVEDFEGKQQDEAVVDSSPATGADSTHLWLMILEELREMKGLALAWSRQSHGGRPGYWTRLSYRINVVFFMCYVVVALFFLTLITRFSSESVLLPGCFGPFEYEPDERGVQFDTPGSGPHTPDSPAPRRVRLRHSECGKSYGSWNDERITWDPAQFCGITQVSLPKEFLWKPDIFIYEMTQSDVALPNPYLYMTNEGKVFMEEDLKVVSTCRMDVHKFPFDTQSCNITITSVIHSSEGDTVCSLWTLQVQHLYFESRFFKGAVVNELRLVPSSNSSRVTQFSHRLMQTQGEWEFLSLSVTNNTFVLNKGCWDQIIYTISMKRRPLLHVINFLLPVLFFLCLDLSSFLISDHRGDKLGYKVTVLLAISVLLLILNEILPSMSNRTPLIATYCIVIFALMLLSLLETVLVTYLMEKDSRILVENAEQKWSRASDSYRNTCKEGNCTHGSAVCNGSRGETPHELLPVAEEGVNNPQRADSHLLLLILEELREMRSLSGSRSTQGPGGKTGYWTRMARRTNTAFFSFYLTARPSLDEASSQKVCSYYDVLQHLNVSKNNEIHTLTRPVLDHTKPTDVYLEVAFYAILDMRCNLTFNSITHTSGCFVGLIMRYIEPIPTCTIAVVHVASRVCVCVLYTIRYIKETLLSKRQVIKKQVVDIGDGTQYLFGWKSNSTPYMVVLYVHAKVKVMVNSFAAVELPYFPLICNSISGEELKLYPSDDSEIVTYWTQKVMQMQDEWIFCSVTVTNSSRQYHPDAIVYTMFILCKHHKVGTHGEMRRVCFSMHSMHDIISEVIS
ncbi:5-hydroxytryptamine receptor 3C [Merluccius polli]|uniref:5-hydroxytryptamine receptor 3C n=1 Tax=Merluccius polli TaxID=89951 RepID=A0AA47M6A3_MERPO|nr:5-hydroxytryptamine receptor 3C [Merluccius polli]